MPFSDPPHCACRFVRLERQLHGPPGVEVVLVLGQVEYLLHHDPGRFTPREVANLANALGKLRYDWGGERDWVGVLLDKVAAWVSARPEGLRDFNAIDLANLTNAFAKAGHRPSRELLSQIADACVHLEPSSFAPQAFSNLIHGFAKWGAHPGRPLLALVTRECSRRSLTPFSPQDLVNILHGFERLNAPLPPKLLHRVAAECVERGLVGFTPLDVANLLHVFDSRGVALDQAFLDTVAAHGLACGLEGFSSAQLAETAQALAQLQHPPSEALLDLLCKACAGQQPFPRLEPLHITQILDALARLRHHLGEGRQGRILEILKEQRFADLDQPQLLTLIQAMARLQCTPNKRWMSAFLAHCGKDGWDRFATSDLAGILWAAVVLRAHVRRSLAEALAARLEAAEQEGDQEETLLHTCTTVRQALSLLDARHCEGLQRLTKAIEGMGTKGKGGPDGQTKAELPTGLVESLRASYGAVETGVWVVEGLLWLDVVITLPCGAKVGVGVDGPTHFFSNRPELPMGDALIRWRLLDKAVELGVLQGWVSVRDGSAEEMEKVQQAVQAVKVGRQEGEARGGEE